MTGGRDGQARVSEFSVFCGSLWSLDSGDMTRHQSPAHLTSRVAFAAVSLTAAVLLLGFAEPAAAAEITVDTKAGSQADGKCSLGEAIEAANTDAAIDACPAGAGDDLITFNADEYGPIRAPTGGFQITSNMTIQGDGEDEVYDGFDIVLTADNSSDAVTAVTLAGLRMHGSGIGVHVKDESSAAVEITYAVVLENLYLAGYDTGVSVDKAVNSGRTGNITIQNSEIHRSIYTGNNGVHLDACDMVEPFHEVVLTVSNSFLTWWGSGGGTGVHNDCGYLKVIGSTIAAQRDDGVSASGGKLGKGTNAGKAASTKTEIINTTIDGNLGVGVSLWKNSSLLKPELLIVNSTITDNRDGGIRTKWEGTGRHDGEYFDVEVINSVVADNRDRQCQLADSLVSGANSGNASSDDSCGFGLVRRNFWLGELWRGLLDVGRGGFARTRAVSKYSPLLDAVTGPHCPHEKAPTDARGVSRPQGSACDIGAYEATRAELEARMWGIDRYGTAAAISRETFDPGVGTVYVATGEGFADALAGSAASGGPILLVKRDWIPPATLDELRRLKPKRIVVLGGTGAVSADVESELRRWAFGVGRRDVSRLAGPDRYWTAAVVSAAHFDPGAAAAYVATGENYPDALAGGPAAAKLGGPILLTREGALPSATVWELRRLKPKRVVVLGGTSVVSTAVEKALAAYTSGEVSRLAGPDRFATAAVVSAAHFAPGAAVAYVATGLDYPDALAGGAALNGAGPILLTMRDSIPKETRDELARLKPKQVVVLGSESVVSKTTENAVAAFVR